MSVNSSLRAAHTHGAETTDRDLVISWPWWIHPLWALVLLTGSMALVAITLGDSAYVLWGVGKYLTGDLSLVLIAGIMVTILGIIIGSGMSARGGSTVVHVTPRQIAYLRRAYRLMFTLAIISYAIWLGSAVRQGVGIGDLISVVDRELGAISQLKSNARPISGVTTLTQLAPVVAAIGLILRRLGAGGRGWILLVLLAGVRTLFYAERLALIEVLIPVLLVSALTVNPDSKWRLLSRAAPIIVAPLVWTVFAMSEYTRSWIYYQMTTNLPFAEWVSVRLAGYYVTSFNNSAIFATSHAGAYGSPYFSVAAFWNAPGMPSHDGIQGFPPEDWWTYTLETMGNREFNNTGSFLVTYAELGLVGMLVFWLVVGLALGKLYASLTKGGLPALIAYATVFVGILELPRFIYWTQGRAVPLLVALVIIGLTYPRAKNVLVPKNRIPDWASGPAGQRLMENRRANKTSS